MKTEIKDGNVTLTLTPEQLEMLYEGLDAASDRYSMWLDSAREQPQVDKLEQDMERCDALSKELSPVVAAVRECYPI